MGMAQRRSTYSFASVHQLITEFRNVGVRPEQIEIARNAACKLYALEMRLIRAVPEREGGNAIAARGPEYYRRLVPLNPQSTMKESPQRG